MFNQDTAAPIRGILSALKLGVAGFVATFGLLFMLNSKGTAGAGEGEGAGEGAGDEGKGGEGDDAGSDDKGGAAGGGASADWRANLPAEVKDHPILGKYKDSTEAVVALVAAQKLIGADKVVLPGKNATPEELTEFYSKIGRPKTAAEYTLPKVEIPKEIPIDKNLIEGFKGKAHELGLMPGQVAGMYKWFMEAQIEAFNGFTQQRGMSEAEATKQLNKEYGAAYGQNIESAQRVLQKFGTKEAIEELRLSGKGNNPHIVRMFVNIAKAMSEDQLVGKPKSLTMEPAEAQAKIAKIKGDMAHPLWVAGHPEHALAVKEWESLHMLANPEG